MTLMTLIETFADRAVALADRFVAFARANPFRLEERELVGGHRRETPHNRQR